MIQSFVAWWHVVIWDHTQETRKVSVPAFDPGAKGKFIKCSCGSSWAL